MHSILESDGVFSDPHEVLCHMGTLIIEGRTPKIIGDLTLAGETTAKSAKPYNEGPHCPNLMKLYTKDTHNGHKCTENNMLCIRYNNLKVHLQMLQYTSPYICIEVSLGPDCLCGELRSQSTLVSGQPSKRDIILEQWTVTISQKQPHEPSSQMSVMNLYQAVRSLLHFSQLTAWYMSHNGAKPGHVVYRVCTPEDSTFITDDNFVNHDFPVADINKTVSLKISVKTLPRMEKIPTVYCPQHPSPTAELPQTSHFDGKESQKLSKEKPYLNPEPLHSKFSQDTKGELLENALLLKFQGVRKKTYEAQERKRKKHITLFDRSPAVDINDCSSVVFVDGLPIDVNKMSPKEEASIFSSKRMFQGDSFKSYQGESSKTEYKKSKSSPFSMDISDLASPQSSFESFNMFTCNYLKQKVVDPTIDLMVVFNSLSDPKAHSDFRTKGKMKVNSSHDSNSESPGKNSEAKTVMDILDDRMQISCAISGKHHCKWECEDENDLNNPGGNVEKPKRRRSLSKVRVGPEDFKLGSSDSERILHGKFKEVDCNKSGLRSPLREDEADNLEDYVEAACKETSGWSYRKLNPYKVIHLKSPPKPNAAVDVSCSLAGSKNNKTPNIQSLPVFEAPMRESQFAASEQKVVESAVENGSSLTEISPEKPSGSLKWESLESFKKGCAAASDAAADYTSESESESSEGSSETVNPFLAAILRTTKKSRASAGKRDSKLAKCDKGKCSGSGRTSEGTDWPKRSPKKDDGKEKAAESKAKADICEKVQTENGERRVVRVCCGTNRTYGKSLDLRMPRKKSSAVRNLKDLDGGENSASSEFLSKSLSKLKCLFDNKDLKYEERTSDGSEDSISNNQNNTKTIPVPSAHDKLKFRRSLDSAAQLVFHRCSGLPLTSSPAPVRRNNNSFSFDSSLNSVSAIKSALFEPANSLSSEDENESEGSLKSPASPGAWSVGSKQINYHSLSPLPLLGSFEESVLNGRLEPVSTVQGFTAELGASGSFCPRHLHLPVTVFFYTLGDNDKVSAPYLGHINLGKKGYNVPRSGTIQVTLFNPLRTVVKMFVVVYDLHDMPANSHTFLRQRTLYVPASQRESTHTDKKEIPFEGGEDYHKYLRYLIHLRFVSGKTGRIYLHTDIRMVIFRKADEDTATALENQADGETYELRSHTHGPTNPKFSPRK